MTADLDLTVTGPGHALRDRLLALDCRLFEAVAARHWPGADPLLPKLSRSANHGLLWFGTAAALAATRSPRARRAAVRGVASLALASATINTLGKRSVRRPRPLLDAVPMVRQLKRQPITTSFPSGHSASAAAFATGVALESRPLGAVVAPVAAAVALSRIYTGAHFPSDVLVGAAFGAGAAFAVRGLVPTRDQLPPPGRPRADAPALPDGEGLVMVVNKAAGSSDRVRALGDALPRAELVECEPADLRAELEKAAARAEVLGVCGGDGTVNAAATVALRHRLPLAVLPGGTLNHFAQDLGVEDVRDLSQALREGDAVRVDVGLFSADGTEGYFLNTCSLGVYPELVRERDRWSKRIGGWPAGVVATLRVLRADRHPLKAELGGKEHPLWLLFAGNGTYHRMGPLPARRYDLADGRLDVRVVHGGRFPAVRLLAAAVAGPLTRSPAHAAVRVGALRVEGVEPGTLLAYDGEVTTVEGEVTLRKLPEALTVYRPLQQRR
ncbi:diacylglycerol kinase family enzyme/membrane-associated phospholipid phosphatase [Streptomyces umbrinus]|uniref:Diacylglycerol kinase family enzyme/membrane-associated phospholipid phosphatase n=1 Tax=Streptomyces umbrinus TaxID=67370 RepID=A0ABU0SMY8_9ACTN|nr:bifunctional phosphatase PAP2/diacylglycerol kinase family protein [Streptomyces umbrinus]MDQ1024913.1 diacylglycerol kinase family enzyme/membrane-associated phospholipid phosphatase [Streptomyces umbrinus]